MLINKESRITLGIKTTQKTYFSELNPLCFIAVLSIINAILPAMMLALKQQSLTDALLSGFGQSYIIWFSLFVCFQLYALHKKEGPPQRAPQLWQYILALLLSISLVFPFSLSSWLSATFAATVWLISLPKTKQQGLIAYTAILLLAISIREPSAQLFLQVFAEQILSMDAQLAFHLLDLFSSNVSLQNNIIVNEEGASLVILTGCSAFGNLSLALLLYLSLTLFWYQSWQSRDFYKSTILILLVLITNSSRLALMSISDDTYTFIHDGMGADIFNFTVLVLPFLVARRLTKEKATNE